MSHSQDDKINLMLHTLRDWYDNQEIPEFIPGKSYIKVAQPDMHFTDYQFMLQAILDGRWAEGGRFTDLAEELLSEITHQDYITLCNSGSSADLLAFSALNERFGTEKVITTALNFPTTIVPALQAGKEVVFIDSDPITLAPNYEQLETCVRSNLTKSLGIILAHTLGFPFDEEEVLASTPSGIPMWYLFDCCDALGAIINDYPVGTNANLSTYSFYPAHHVSSIEGGAVCGNSKEMARIVESYRNWGRDCYCPPNEDNTCKMRFRQRWGQLPFGYDHKYVTARLGYNLKMTEIQAALLYSQLQSIESIRDGRKMNFNTLRIGLTDLEEYFGFIKIEASAIPSPFGFPIMVKKPLSRLKLIRYLEDHKIGTRLVFGGNLTRQPGFIPYVNSGQIQTPFSLTGADEITENMFWISCNQNLTSEMMNYIIETLHQAVKETIK